MIETVPTNFSAQPRDLRRPRIPLIDARRGARGLGLALIAMLLLSVATTAMAQPVSAAPPADSDLLAHGSASRFWVAQAVPASGLGKGEQTRIYVRHEGESAWQELTQIPGRVSGLASRGSQLAVVMPDGQWLFLTSSGSTSSGQELPADAHLLALGSGDETIYALGLTTGSLPATRPASRPVGATLTTRPAPPRATQAELSITTRPATTTAASADAPTEHILLYLLAPQGWQAMAELPPQPAPAKQLRLSIANIGGMPYVAIGRPDGAIAVLRFDAKQNQWEDWALLPQVNLEFAATSFKLLSGADLPVLWVAGAGGRESLAFLRASQPVISKLESAPGASARAATFANGAIRRVRLVDNKLYEEAVDPRTGQRVAAAQPLSLPPASLTPLFNNMLHTALVVALLFAIGASLFRRRELQGAVEEIQKVALAPLGTRLMAGMIDATPLLTAMGLDLWMGRPIREDTASSVPMSPTMLLILVSGAVIYLFHVTLAEMLTGRSLGKWLFGLRVVNFDGKPVTPGAAVTRNLLRIIDWGLGFLPLLLVTLSPLRQRPADVAAGTLVVLNKPVEPPPADEPPPDEPKP